MLLDTLDQPMVYGGGTAIQILIMWLLRFDPGRRLFAGFLQKLNEVRPFLQVIDDGVELPRRVTREQVHRRDTLGGRPARGQTGQKQGADEDRTEPGHGDRRSYNFQLTTNNWQLVHATSQHCVAYCATSFAMCSSTLS